MKHTKGPWKADRLRSIYQKSDADSQLRIAEAFVMARREKNLNNPSLVAEAQANALLIAAAPELLDELMVSIERGIKLGYSCEVQLELYKNITGEEYVEEYHRRKAKGE